MNNLKNLRASLPATMAGMASQAGLRLAFGQPRTNGKTVWVTDIPLNPSEDDYYVTLGDLGHEIGHIRYTDFNVMGSGLSQALNNVFEDVRIERVLEQDFLGMKDFLERSYQIVMAQGKARQPDSPANALTMYLLTKYMIEVNARTFFQEECDQALAALQSYVDDKLIQQIDALCDQRVPTLGSTRDCLNLAHDVIALLEQEQNNEDDDSGDEPGESDAEQDSESSEGSSGQDEEEDSDSQKDSDSTSSEADEESEGDDATSGDGSGDDQDEDSDSQDDSESDGSGSSAGDESEDGESEGDASGETDSDGSQQESGSETDSGSGESDSQGEQTDTDESSSGCSKNGAKDLLDSDVEESSPISLREAAQEIAEQARNDENSTKELLGNSNDIAQELREMNGSGSNHNFYGDRLSPDLPRYNQIKASVAKETQFFRNRLLQHWTNQSRTRNVVNDHDGRFSAPDAIRCMATGEDNFLVKRSKRVNNKPAVCLLGDLSGSMDDFVGGNATLLDLQTRTMIALAETCNIGNVPLNILGFSDYVLPLKRWNEPMVKSRAMLGGQNIISGTEIVPAVFEGIRALASRKEQRKIMIVMTDGSIGNDKVALRNLVDYAEKHIPGIEFYGLGMGVNLKSVFSKGGMVEPENISQTVLDILV